MEERKVSFSLHVHVALEDGLANCTVIIGLVSLSFGLLVSGLWRHSIVVFRSVHEAIVSSCVNDGVWLLTAEQSIKMQQKCMVCTVCTRERCFLELSSLVHS